MRKQDRSKELFTRAQALIPGGVNSPARAFGGVGGTPFFVSKGKGCRLWDEDGNEYIDYIGSWGPLILGHANADVLKSVHEVMDLGTSFGASTARESRLAEIIINRVPSIEKVRLVNSGTEATLSAIRLARGFTCRDKIIKFEGGYHGHVDALLVSAGSGVATLGIPGCPGIPVGTIADTLALPYNNLDAVRTAFREHKGAIAAVIVEPVAGNMGTVPPQPGYLEGLREITKSEGALLIFDEVMSGFRVSPGGAQQLYNVTPDLTTLGKVIGGGFPIGAYGGRKDIMDHVAPSGTVYQAGTLSGNPVAVQAGIRMLELLGEPGVYELLESRSARLEKGLRRVMSDHDIPHRINRAGSMMTLFFTETEVIDYQTAKTCDTKRFARFFHGMLDEGVSLPPSQFEAFFVSTAHEESDIDATVEAAERVTGNG